MEIEWRERGGLTTDLFKSLVIIKIFDQQGRSEKLRKI